MMRGRRALRDSQAPSPEGSEDDEARSPVSNFGDETIELKTPPMGRGRKSNEATGSGDSKRDAMDVMH